MQFPHKFSDPNNIELTAFVSALFAYGKINQIISTLNKFIQLSENNPYEYLLHFDKRSKIHFSHRFYSNDDIKNLFLAINFFIKKYGSIKKVFLRGYSAEDKNLKNAITNFSNTFLSYFKDQEIEINHALKFMFPLPTKGSACKRLNLFLRWMIRKDNIDFGLWSEIPKNKLIIPVDTHIARISKKLRLTKRKIVSWNMAEEITENLKKFDSNDPVKYDFSLCHIGIKKSKF
ncbi:MAG: TIGR02757 family protein [Ignavibacterium sp.]|nr:TIGR02757 family protein [Ignavibacterium sp.]MDW8374495.1 TIGR02757 family protein [Ignavibacteriales bacterium]